MYNDGEHSKVVEKSPREGLFNHKNKDWWSQGEVCYMNVKSICTERFSDVKRSPFLMPWWKFMALVMRSSRPQVWVKPPLEFSCIFAVCKAGGTIIIITISTIVYGNTARWDKKPWTRRGKNRRDSEGQSFMVTGWKQKKLKMQSAHILWVTKNPFICWNISAK